MEIRFAHALPGLTVRPGCVLVASAAESDEVFARTPGLLRIAVSRSAVLVSSVVLGVDIWYGGVPVNQRHAVGTERLTMEMFQNTSGGAWNA